MNIYGIYLMSQKSSVRYKRDLSLSYSLSLTVETEVTLFEVSLSDRKDLELPLKKIMLMQYH